jgi:hypothetical protein
MGTATSRKNLPSAAVDFAEPACFGAAVKFVPSRRRAAQSVARCALFASSFYLSGCSSSGASGSDGGLPADAGAEAASDAAGAADAPDCGPLVWTPSACASCTHASCCQLEEQCLSIASCVPLNECFTACGTDAGCTQGCGARYVDAISNYNAILNCQITSCASQCNE